MKRMVGDRRNRCRFEILGNLWGRIDTSVPLLVRNINRGGALLESPAPLADDTVHWVTAIADGQPHLVKIRVRHSHQTRQDNEGQRFWIGVEFLKLPRAVEEAIERLEIGRDSGFLAEI